MGAPIDRIYFGDFRLWQAALGPPSEVPKRSVLQQFSGVDQANELVVPASSNMGLELLARTVGEPNPAAKTELGWAAIKRALRQALTARSLRSDPLCYVSDPVNFGDTVGSYAAPVITAAGHPFSNGEVVLVRRAGVGDFSLGAVSSVLTNTFVLGGVAGGPAFHAIAPGDEIFRVDLYWLGLAVTGPPEAVPPNETDGDWFAPQVTYRFRGAGRYDYARIAAAVGS